MTCIGAKLAISGHRVPVSLAIHGLPSQGEPGIAARSGLGSLSGGASRAHRARDVCGSAVGLI